MPPTAPVRGVAPPAPPPPASKRSRGWRLRPPPGTLALTGLLAAFALGGFGYAAVRLTAGLWPQGPRPLRAPVSDALMTACETHPAICRGSVRLRFRH
jgi:hypothetical protein